LVKLGYDSTEELIGRPLLSFWLHPEQRQKFLEILNYKGYVNDYEMTLKRKDGTPIEVSTSSYFYFDSAGNRLGTEGIARDITDRKRTEEQLREAHDMLKGYSARLEKEVQERTKDALEAQQQAEFANKAKSEFLANMNHELKTPLNAVIGFSEVMLNGLCGQLNERQVENLNYIYRGGKHLQRLIDGILELSRIEAGRMELDISEFLVKDVIQSSLFLFSEKAKRHSLELTYEVEEGLESITADPIMVKQVLCSLLSNAIKFTPDGGSIRVSAALRDNGKSVEFAVRDTGIGIAPEDQPKLFRPFTQLDSSYTKKYAGAGVGLRICKEIASLHGGTLEVKSVPGNGSTFYFTIPRHVGP
ncbi:MAG TPA: PAS domain-containing sensor histidine kinase, partial [Dissulfurispiraceae bacterium]|nr:PAS domain-containing sensor histidine kinase [Dissulfurispiraceae bacterium]